MAGITPTISIITLNMNELNIPIKSQGLVGCIFFKKNPIRSNYKQHILKITLQTVTTGELENIYKAQTK